MRWAVLLAGVVAGAGGVARAGDDAPVSFSREVLPFLEEQCIACHDEGFETSDLSVASVEAMVKGGRRGPAIVRGKAADSLLIQFLKGIKQPQMPPKTSIPLDQVEVIERWINQGAKVDATQAVIAERQQARKAAEEREAAAFASDAPPPVTALAYSPDGKVLAVASYKDVILVDPASGTTLRRLVGFPDQVTAVSFSSDGRRLAGAGGMPGKQGEIRIWDASGWTEVRVLRGHADTALAVAWRPNSGQLASSSTDKLILVWDAEAGKVVRTIKNHADIVASLAYSQDGKRLASGSADKTAKIYDADTGLQTASLASHDESVLQVAFSPDNAYLATASADRQIRLWKLDNLANPQRGFGHTGPVYGLTWRPDSSSLFAGAGGKPSVLSYQRDNGNRAVPIKDETMPQDWVYAVAAAPDNQAVAAGGWDGSVTIWSLKDGARLRAFVPGADE